MALPWDSAIPRRDFSPGMLKGVHTAQVISYTAGYNFYTVVLAEGGPLRKAVGRGGSSGFGVRDVSPMPPGTIIAVLDATGYQMAGSRSEYLEIIGEYTGTTQNQSLSLSDAQDLLSGAGYLFDKVHNFLADQRTGPTGPLAMGDGAPVDALGGERGAYSALGPGWLTALAVAYMRASERCGIWMYRLDEHLRVVAKSMETQTLSREVLELYDDGELSVLERVAFVPWEALGAFANGTPTGTVSSQSFSDPSAPPTEFPVKTVSVDQRSIFRLIDIKGYLGDLQHEFVQLPMGTGIDAYGSNADKFQGVYRRDVAADGTLWVQSAKGIHLEKYPLIQLPLQKRNPDDPRGDTPKNYKASNAFGAGPAQTRKDWVQPEPQFTGDKGILGLDLHGGYISSAALQTLRGHTKDWDVQNEGDTPFAQQLGGGLYNAAAGYALDPRSMWMPPPRFITAKIQDGRWEGVRYYLGRAAIDLWDDGSVTAEDAWGSQLIMTGGNAILTAPNDIIMAPGRSFKVLAPEDIVLRAGNSADLTASRRDVHIKGERNVVVIGGNSGKGGVLIESRDTGGSFSYGTPGEGVEIQGVVFSAPRSVVAAVGQQISLIASDTVLVQAATRLGFVAPAVHVETTTYFEVTAGNTSGDAGGSPSDLVSYRFGNDRCDLGLGREIPVAIRGALSVTQGFSVQQTSFLGGSVTVSGSLAASGGLAAPAGAVSPLASSSPSDFDRQRRNLFGEVTSIGKTVLSVITAVRAALQALLGAPESYFNPEEVQAKVTGSLRTSEDYGTDVSGGFLMVQWRWQEYAGEGKKWVDPAVQGATGPTYPWPGDSWSSGEYRVYSSTAFDITTGVAIASPPGTAATFVSSAPVASYIVNSNEG